ncbi:gamma-glutamyl-gamma-aminobutyrate hydrolase family protein [Parabacteroides sp. PF5-6]|uniref:gamma-glutamyl-gamma-aminobutyrate hydrolase family protein n=1 Tax=Parabacteroides sp. PF5-6 TaxID=1742403 RepID=UPI00240508AE|nr:gamma-glutamyl-gamma-aminobutyrate hydrolase family protein [Parabacteroides sp. PF5-6]MDF9830785.1 gamma-glutamyl-gamma-aminobutyrate hydrolase PuuD [Parabacteroides sp. PF5-6]
MKNSLSTAGIFLFLLLLQAPGIRSQQTKLQTFHARMDSCEANLRNQRPPLIGISATQQSGGSTIGGAYVQAVVKAGGAPVIIPVIEDEAALRQILSTLDGLVMTGGEDVNPLWYNEEPVQQLQAVDPVRDTYDLMLIKLASDRNIPILGICRGEQLINVAFGGTLYQDLPSQHPNKPVKHVQQMPKTFGAHTIDIQPQTQLSAILGQSSYAVNSFHHQAVKELAPGFRVAAYSRDSVIEAIEAWPDRPILGVQWHPEGHVAGGDTTMLRIFRFLIDKADIYRSNKELPPSGKNSLSLYPNF